MSHDDELPTGSPRRIMIFRVLAVLIGLLFVAAGVTNARAGFVLVVGTSGDAHAELNRWFTTVAGTSDLIGAACFLVLAWRPALYLLFSFVAMAFVVAAVVNLPFVPEFAVLLAVVLLPLIAYPFWAQLRTFPRWWGGSRGPMLWVTALGAVVLLPLAAISVVRQIGGTDAAAQANWWADYAEHITLLALAGLLASTRQPGWRVLGGLAAAAWIYLGLVAGFALPDHTASWGTVGGVAAMLLGATLAVICARGEPHPQDVPKPQPSV